MPVFVFAARLSARTRATLLSLALALAVTLHGRVVDNTTGQPLVKVGIDVYAGKTTSGKRVSRALTDSDGRFSLHGLHAGWYSLALSSDDVPRLEETIHVDPAHPHDLEFSACSTTLDYSCAPKFDIPKDNSNSNG